MIRFLLSKILVDFVIFTYEFCLLLKVTEINMQNIGNRTNNLSSVTLNFSALKRKGNENKISIFRTELNQIFPSSTKISMIKIKVFILS